MPIIYQRPGQPKRKSWWILLSEAESPTRKEKRIGGFPTKEDAELFLGETLKRDQESRERNDLRQYYSARIDHLEQENERLRSHVLERERYARHLEVQLGLRYSQIDRNDGISDPGVKNPAAVALGRLGGSKGGRARAAKLSAKQRRQIARQAARTRWSKQRGTR